MKFVTNLWVIGWTLTLIGTWVIFFQLNHGSRSVTWPSEDFFLKFPDYLMTTGACLVLIGIVLVLYKLSRH